MPIAVNRLASFRKTIVLSLTLALAFAVSGDLTALENTPLSYGPGVADITVKDKRSDRPLSGDIWFPSTTPDRHVRADKSKVWQMAPADRDAVMAEGQFPLLVVSHGMYGNTFNQAWLASELARRGYIVAMINHPGTSTFLRDPSQARELWDRPVDVSRLISHLLQDDTYGPRIDRSRIFAAGHSLGGFTVMFLAGAEFDNARYQNVCGSEPTLVVCEVLRGWSVAETEADRVEMAASRKDERIRKVISLDLGGTPVFSRKSLQQIETPILVLGSGRADMLDQDVESRALAAALPADSVTHLELEGAGHFDFMGVCKPDGFDILKEHEPGDEIVCIKGNAERVAQHDRILTEILTFLTQ
ncbi:alpha/beta fold hydrolase [Roseibium sp. HPY-6]|uniref:alpha/beta hydrolase family protein n=1 Tax=Roseibium sp. HPY-6 TaxID=3229852 RepID=UPI00338F904C